MKQRDRLSIRDWTYATFFSICVYCRLQWPRPDWEHATPTSHMQIVQFWADHMRESWILFTSLAIITSVGFAISNRKSQTMKRFLPWVFAGVLMVSVQSIIYPGETSWSLTPPHLMGKIAIEAAGYYLLYSWPLILGLFWQSRNAIRYRPPNETL